MTKKLLSLSVKALIISTRKNIIKIQIYTIITGNSLLMIYKNYC